VGAVLLSFMLFGGGLASIDNPTWAPVAMISSPVLLLGAAIYGLYACRMVWPQRMTGDYIWLNGVNTSFLDRLEPWQWNL